MGVEAELEETGGLARTVKDLFAGAAGGVAQVLLGKYIVLRFWLVNLSVSLQVCHAFGAFLTSGAFLLILYSRNYLALYEPISFNCSSFSGLLCFHPGYELMLTHSFTGQPFGMWAGRIFSVPG